MKKNILLFLCFLSFSAAYSQNWDINTSKRINSWDGKLVRNYSKAISKSTPYVAVAIPLAIASYAGMRNDQSLLKDAVYIGTSVGGALALTYGLKYTVDRKRPYERYPDKISVQDRESSPSFPSAHTAVAFSLATSLSIKYPKWYVIAPSALWATSVGFARVNEGVHYPSDVLAGAAIGVGCAVVNVYVNKWLNRWLFH
ncbi:phosphatase PAP2 family protein [Bacteroides sp. 224]|uniref:phosphatase PAP2 family protein n=1 Tax=Bacteroides sp. 224 TaxID=2302936 RepID=UPI0013D1098B|nr:phosphatase PAP2 family protein [Bacteroides sp. 224]NDV64190.1 PAP2 family protein [Bacteroides sp. 224]